KGFTLPRRRLNEWLTGPRRCSRRELLSSRCTGHSVIMTKYASSRRRTMRRLAVCYCPRTFWAISGHRRCVLLRASRWRKFSPIFPNRSKAELFARKQDGCYLTIMIGGAAAPDGESISWTLGSRQCAGAWLGSSELSPDKRVDVCADSDEDRGSTPLASSPESFRGCHVGVKRRRAYQSPLVSPLQGYCLAGQPC